MNRFTTRCATLQLLVLAAAAQAASYRIVDLGSHIPFQIDKRGEIAGWDTSRAVVYRRGDWHILPGQGGGFGQAVGMNGGGDVVGHVTRDADSEPMLWPRGGKAMVLPLPHRATIGEANAVSGSQVVVGFYIVRDSFAVRHCFRWSAEDGAVDIGLMAQGHTCEAWAINLAGQIVGQATASAQDEGHAFVYENGAFHDLGTFGGDYSFAYDIDNQGRVIGEAGLHPFATVGHAFLWSGGALKDLGSNSTEFPYSAATSINGHGDIVGVGLFPDFRPRAVRFANDRIISLESEVEELGDWTLDSANSINDEGVIVGTGFRGDFLTHGFKLVPIARISE